MKPFEKAYQFLVQLLTAGRLVCLTIGFASHASLTDAQDASITEIGFVVPEGREAGAMNVEGCEFISPAANGEELVFACPLQPIYQVTLADDEEPKFGHIQIRPEATFATPLGGPVHIVAAYSETENDSFSKFEAQNEINKPLALSDAAPQTQVAVSAVEPAEETEGVDLILSWSASLGSLKFGDQIIEGIRDEGEETFNATLALTSAMGEEIELAVARNPECTTLAATADLEEGGALEFPCIERKISLPIGFAVDLFSCQQAELELTCLVPVSQMNMSLELPGWKPVSVVFSENSEENAILSLADLRPSFPATLATSSLNELSEESCEQASYDLSVSKICNGDACADVTEDMAALASDGYLADLQIIRWSENALPSSLYVALTKRIGGVVDAVTTAEMDIASMTSEALVGFIENNVTSIQYKLDVSVEGKIYKFGRKLSVFADAACTKPVQGAFLDLSNPGNKMPMVPQCGYYQILDDSKPRSDCMALEFDAERERVSAVAEVAACGDQRLVLAVVENETLNGSIGQAVNAALIDLASTLRGQEQCAPLDVVHMIEEKRETLVSAEDIHLADGEAGFQNAFQMSFVNPSSEVLRDFDWINRTWGENLGGLIVVLDGSKTNPTNMTDSPAAMAWTINQKFRRVIDVSQGNNCGVFTDTLRFEDCVSSTSDAFSNELKTLVEEGLTQLQNAQ